MTTTIAPTQSSVTTGLRSFLLNVLAPGTEVILAQQNRTPEPVGTEFCVMTPIGFRRLTTNVDTAIDAKFTGSIALTTMTVTAVQLGAIKLGATVFGLGVASNTTVTAFGSGTGQAGTYTVTPSQSLASQTLSAGQVILEQDVEVRVQLDFHSASSAGGDMAQIFSTAFRDEYAVRYFDYNSPGIEPLYSDTAVEIPFLNENQQYEWRWSISAYLQANQSLALPQEFMDEVVTTFIPADIVYAP
jgi:hypothetical protein